ncbi:MAG: TetR/AcrR family transcriptional regulator [Acidimicrobiaceae bacterium]|nr:TetR/AcrR family transcriptional regulator [Acidimicrobiaceae bacterium]
MNRDAVARASGEDERERLIEAMIEVAGVRGLGDTTVEMVVAKARLDHSVFERHFKDLEDCFIQTWHAVRDAYMHRVRHAYDAESAWLDGLRAALGETLRCADRERARARILCVDVLEAGEPARRQRDELLGELAELVDRGRGESDQAADIPATTAHGIVGGVYNRIYESLRHGAAEELVPLGPELMAFAVTPYLGKEAGRRELERAD